MSRSDQDQLLRWVIAAHEAAPGHAPPLPAMPLDRFALAGLATGLTALIGTLADHHGVALPDEWSRLINDQRSEVAGRQARFAALLPDVLSAMSAGGVVAVPVKGAVLSTTVWAFPAARPMADIDLVVAPEDRKRAQIALGTAGFLAHHESAWEDTYLGWGDGSVGRLDGESAAHNGKIEVHPGWVERLHNYLVDDSGLVMALAEPGSLAGQPCSLLPPGALAAQTLGHLSACAIRAEVRAVNVLDVVLAVGSLDPPELDRFHDLVEALDGRLTAPGLWLVEHYRPGAIDARAVAAAHRRLGSAANRRLVERDPSAVLRAFGTRTSLSWRLSFAATCRERLAVLRQVIRPAEERLSTRLRRTIGRRP